MKNIFTIFAIPLVLLFCALDVSLMAQNQSLALIKLEWQTPSVCESRELWPPGSDLVRIQC